MVTSATRLFQSQEVADQATAQRYYAGKEITVYGPDRQKFDGRTTQKGDYIEHELPAKPACPPPPSARRVPFEGTTTNRDHFPPHEITVEEPPTRQQQYRSPNIPFEGLSETQDKYRAHPMQARLPAPAPPMRPSLPFEGISEATDRFRGWQLPERRPSLGVQVVGDRFYTLIPGDAALPALGKQTFTTVHDDQTELCILILQGGDSVASRNKLLGQFDLIGIPPAPAGQPQFEVTFSVDADNVLSASAIDLSDEERHQNWLLSGDMIARTMSKDVQVVTEAPAPPASAAISAH